MINLTKPIFFALVLGSTLVTGCSSLTPPKEKPVLENKVGDRIGTVATTAERRVILIDLDKDHFCAEPSPDVAEAINSTIKAAAEASAKSTSGHDAKVSAEIGKSLATSINNVFTRTQGVQLFRDGSYALCQARMNGDIKDQAFIDRFDKLQKDAVDLIKLELPLVAQRLTQQALSTAQTAAAESKAAATDSKEQAANAAKSAEAAKASENAAKSKD